MGFGTKSIGIILSIMLLLTPYLAHAETGDVTEITTLINPYLKNAVSVLETVIAYAIIVLIFVLAALFAIFLFERAVGSWGVQTAVDRMIRIVVTIFGGIAAIYIISFIISVVSQAAGVPDFGGAVLDVLKGAFTKVGSILQSII